MIPHPPRRSPDGYVAQRLFPESTTAAGTPARPWLITYREHDDEPAGPVTVRALTDDEVAGWPELHDLTTVRPGDRVIVSVEWSDYTPEEAHEYVVRLQRFCPEASFVMVAGQAVVESGTAPLVEL